MARLSKSQIEERLKAAERTFSSGNPEAALAQLDEILRTNPDSGPTHFGRGTLLTSLGRLPEALASFTNSLRIDPNHLDSLAWAAQVSLSLRKSKETESFARKLCRLQPNNDRAHFMLSVGLSLTGKWLDALREIDDALRLQPSSMEYIVGRAQLLRKLHLNTLAIQSYRKALSIQPAPQIARELAEVLMEENHTQEALGLLEHYTLVLPRDARPNMLLARAYTESHQFEKAAPYWAAARKDGSNNTDLIAERAKSEISAGRFTEAEDLLREGLESNPSESRLFGILTPIVKISSADFPLVERMEARLHSTGLNSVEKQSLNYALGKSYNDLEDFAKAMGHFDEANRLRSEIFQGKIAFDAQESITGLKVQIDFFTKERVKQLSAEGLPGGTPLFIVGMIRSGTTLIEQILSCHSKIVAGGESTFWVDHQGEFLEPSSGGMDVLAARRLGREYLNMMSTSQGFAQYVTDKNPLNIFISAALHCVLPNAKFVHVKRHPVDNLLSIWMTPMRTGLQLISRREDLVLVYKQYLKMLEHVREVLPSDRFETFSYEEITSHPDSTIPEIVSFLDLEFEPACLMPERNRRTVRTPSVYQVRQPINPNSQLNWVKYRDWLGPFSELLSR